MTNTPASAMGCSYFPATNVIAARLPVAISPAASENERYRPTATVQAIRPSDR